VHLFFTRLFSCHSSTKDTILCSQITPTFHPRQDWARICKFCSASRHYCCRHCSIRGSHFHAATDACPTSPFVLLLPSFVGPFISCSIYFAAFSWICRHADDPQALKMLLASNADPSIATNTEITALHLVVLRGKIGLARVHAFSRCVDVITTCD
jgi:hypothetical protein